MAAELSSRQRKWPAARRAFSWLGDLEVGRCATRGQSDIRDLTLGFLACMAALQLSAHARRPPVVPGRLTAGASGLSSKPGLPGPSASILKRRR
jgi:hypothetical protein